ncbi:MAG: cytochrome c3 family protein [Bacillota bacterium]|nr:cytochrome c3 family protein [Bacillota bacterium]
MDRAVIRATWGVCLLVLGLAATAHAASIVGSFHDLAHIDDVHTTPPEGWGRTFDDYNEVCVYCHTPHHADQTQGALWNRPAQTTTYTVYSSPTLDSAPGQPGRASKLCLSCHDGSIAVDTVLNPPPYVASAGVHGTMIYPRQQPLVDCGSCHQPAFATWFGDFSPTYFNNSLEAEHPVGITYNPSAPDLVPLPAGGKFPNGVRVIDGKVECLSCHNPHDPAIRPFLVTSNAGSALCYTCHKK